MLSPSSQATPSRQSEQNNQANAVNNVLNELGHAEADEALMVPSGDRKDIDPLAKFLPPPPKEKCSYELQVTLSDLMIMKFGLTYADSPFDLIIKDIIFLLFFRFIYLIIDSYADF